MSIIDWGISREFIDPELNQHVSFWSDELAERDYFAGDTFTAADIQMSMPLQFALGLEVGGDHPRLNRYLTRLEERPAYQRAVEKGGGLSMDF
jgi:glutathione S-transferase